MSLHWGEDCPAPAKINEFLHVVSRLDNGYHRLQTVFRLIDFCDTLRFYPREDDHIVLRSRHEGIDTDNDLATRAAKRLRECSAVSYGVEIEIDKRIPLGSGLGGGSSNAATTLMALNELWELYLPSATLQEIALEIGADVPFFIFGQDAFAQGAGERFLPLELPDRSYLLLFPPVSVSTKAVFSALSTEDFVLEIAPEDYVFGMGGNTLTKPTIALFPEIEPYLSWLSQYCPAQMSGSGATIFGRCVHHNEAVGLLALAPEHFSGIVANNVPRHPLHQKINLS